MFINVFFVVIVLTVTINVPSALSCCGDGASNVVFTGCRCILGSCRSSSGGQVAARGGSTRGFGVASLMGGDSIVSRRVSMCKVTSSDGCMGVGGLDSLGGGRICVSTSFTSGCKLTTNSAMSLSRGCRGGSCGFGMTKLCRGSRDLTIFVSVSGCKGMFRLGRGRFDKFLSSDGVASVSRSGVTAAVAVRSVAGVTSRLSRSVNSCVACFRMLYVLLTTIVVCLLAGLVVRGGRGTVSVAGVLKCRGGRVTDLCLLSADVIIMVTSLVDIVLKALIVTTT